LFDGTIHKAATFDKTPLGRMWMPVTGRTGIHTNRHPLTPTIGPEAKMLGARWRSVVSVKAVALKFEVSWFIRDSLSTAAPPGLSRFARVGIPLRSCPAGGYAATARYDTVAGTVAHLLPRRL
jgi:hypothetical protein